MSPHGHEPREGAERSGSLPSLPILLLLACSQPPQSFPNTPMASVLHQQLTCSPWMASCLQSQGTDGSFSPAWG